MKPEIGNCYINDKKNIRNFGKSKIKKLLGFEFNKETFVYICNCIVQYMNDCVYDSVDFESKNWKENTSKYLKEDALDFYNDELNDYIELDEKQTREFIHNFPKTVKNLIDNNIIIFEN
jgi:hypothetical protein